MSLGGIRFRCHTTLVRSRAKPAAEASEFLICSGRIPRVTFAGLRLTDRPTPLKEPTATIVWQALHGHGLAERTLLWNTVPWHPSREDPFSNRGPTAQEIAVGDHGLDAYLAAPPVQ